MDRSPRKCKQIKRCSSNSPITSESKLFSGIPTGCTNLLTVVTAEMMKGPENAVAKACEGDVIGCPCFEVIFHLQHIFKTNGVSRLFFSALVHSENLRTMKVGRAKGFRGHQGFTAIFCCFFSQLYQCLVRFSWCADPPRTKKKYTERCFSQLGSKN